MPHVSLVTLGVQDVARATAFYERLGWRRSSASVEGVVSFLAGGMVALSLYGGDALTRDAATPATASYAMNVDDRAAVDAALAAATAAGARVTKPAAETEWGGYVGYFSDLDGHLWEVAHNPGFPLGDEGQVFLPGFEEDMARQRAENEAHLTEFITGADGEDGATVRQLAERVLGELRRASDAVEGILAGSAHNVVLATMLELSQRARQVPSTERDFWLASAASTVVSPMIQPPGER